MTIEDQVWTGWPPEGRDNDLATLEACKLTTPVHYLTVAKRRPDPNNPADRANALLTVEGTGGARPRTQAAPLLGSASNPMTVHSDSDMESEGHEEEMMYESEEDEICMLPSSMSTRPANNHLSELYPIHKSIHQH